MFCFCSTTASPEEKDFTVQYAQAELAGSFSRIIRERTYVLSTCADRKCSAYSSDRPPQIVDGLFAISRSCQVPPSEQTLRRQKNR